MKYILALDQGTTSCRSIVYDRQGQVVSLDQCEFRQIYPRPGWVEHDAEEIWNTQMRTISGALERASLSMENIEAIGITNQRETVVVWDAITGKPVHNAIVWQCRRSADICHSLKQKGLERVIREKTGLLLDPYFSAGKITWLLDDDPDLRRQAENGSLRFGTIDSWLIYNLTGKHLTDPSNASRTSLFNIHTGLWDEELLEIFRIPVSLLPEVRPSSGIFAMMKKELFGIEVPVAGVAGDQQASLFGQACFKHGTVKNTYGTGCFMLANTGDTPVESNNRLLTTVAWDLGNGLQYALEGSVFIGAAVVQWLRDELNMIESAEESETLAQSVADNGGVYMVPAFVGLGAPYWDSEARGAIFGLTRGSSRAHLTRAALESVAFQTRDLFEAMKDDLKMPIKSVKIDGGGAANTFLCQFQADLLNIPVLRAPAAMESTSLGAAYLAGLATAYWESTEEIEKKRELRESFEPRLDSFTRETLINNWRNAVDAARAFKL